MNTCKRQMIIIILILVMMVINSIIVIKEQLDYQERIKAGNDRWHQVEERIIQIEEEVGDLRDDRIG